eukprot:CAMPEP_0197394796 /NCGR_PEP_ID=MMETSP1165-20131217/6117_1 /TAXON_ID=284809 /ORGANISM="Chrysocystis fragilis, Strain CCMP3189" /LENGTH=293 /DNA_ID=CAMNT_0042920533 /DNA_START=18 /DNA_END=899 /DNA_ORIENTATION=-
MTAEEDAKLSKLGLAANATLVENRDLDGKEEAYLKEHIVSKLENADAVMSSFDEMSRVRIYRGMITNNKGTEAERTKEAIETYQRIGNWRLESAATVLTTPLKGEELLFKAMNSVVGGLDLYGHMVWGERLGDIASVVDHPVTVDEAKAIRMKMMEAVRLMQTKATEERGPRRYKQVYIIDCGEVSLGTLMTRPKVREMTFALLGSANAFFPETMWKCFIVNAPFVFRSVYAMVSPFIHPVTKEKIKILSGPSKFLPEMQHAGIELEAIPEQFHGKFQHLKLSDCIAKLAAES